MGGKIHPKKYKGSWELKPEMASTPSKLNVLHFLPNNVQLFRCLA